MRQCGQPYQVELLRWGFLLILLFSQPTSAQRLGPLSINPNTVKGGNPAGGRIPTLGISILPFTLDLSSSNTSVATVPGSITLPGSALFGSFDVSTLPVDTTKVVAITVTRGATPRSAILTVLPYYLAGLDAQPASLSSPGTVTITVRIDSPAPPGGISFKGLLSDSSGNFVITVPISGGATSGSLALDINTDRYDVYTVGFTIGGRHLERTFEVIPPLSSVTALATKANAAPSLLIAAQMLAA